ncbi:hypothetical protein [Hyphomicrobium sp.]|jgi:hypothetical protein|uniref:hypothetical protein n=1 Tax=Hyphomicrobium sp. TaxID=82 RepID=UPI002CB95C19|nr:hypothetical protein [Hyphomicrobium sp.]HVZ04355.1 hypothetical protein [Hyphomicrobium sp.]
MSEEKKLRLYASLMEEVKLRLDCTSAALNGRTGFPNPIVREFCYLQLRMLCELIALGCLVAHGDIASLQSHRTGRAYSAEEILARLSELRPHFYPIACKQTRIQVGSSFEFELNILHPQPLPKEDLLSLYGKTHKFLHRGNIKKLLSSATSIDMEINLPEISSWGQKIANHLAIQMIAISEKKVMLCTLRNADDNHRVQVATAKKPE